MAALRLAAALVRASDALTTLKVEYALIGGLAVSARVEPRTTRDVDFAIAVGSDDEAEQHIHNLVGTGYSVQTVLEQTKTNRLATVRLTHSDQPRVLVDLLFASTGIEPEIVRSAEPMTVLEAKLPVATIPYLIAMKLLARNDRKRPQDWDDLRGLLLNSSPAMLQEARSALALIETRGAHRGRNLMAMLDEAIREFLDVLG